MMAIAIAHCFAKGLDSLELVIIIIIPYNLGLLFAPIN